MNRSLGIALVILSVIAMLNAYGVQAQSASSCAQNAAYWQQWQASADAHYMESPNWEDWKNKTPFLAVSPDGATLAVAFEEQLTLYDAETLQVKRSLEPASPLDGRNLPENAVFRDANYVGLAWSPDGRQLAAAYRVFDSPDRRYPFNGIQLWEVEAGRLVRLLVSRPEAIAWSPDGATIASTDPDGNVWLWEVATHAAVQFYDRRAEGERMELISWSPDGRYFAASFPWTGPLRLYDMETNALRFADSPDDMVVFVAWSPDGATVVTGSWLTDKLYFFDTTTTRLLKTLAIFSPSPGSVYDVQWSPDGRWLARGITAGLIVWDMTSDHPEPARRFVENMPPLVRIAWLPDSQHLISVDFDGSLYRWDTETGCVEAAVLKDAVD